MFRVHTENPHDAVALDDLALVANLLDAGSNFHVSMASLARIVVPFLNVLYSSRLTLRRAYG